MNRVPIPDRERNAMRALYALGYSAQEIGNLFGRLRTVVQHWVGKGWEAREAKRGTHGPVPRTFSERYYRSLARRIYERHHKVKLRREQHVHHIDHDYRNFDISNLTVLLAGEHAHHHHPPNPIPRGQRPKRIAYQKQYMKSYRSRK